VFHERQRALFRIAPLVLALAACAGPPAPPPAPPAPVETGLERRPIPPSGIHVVAPGETLSEIAYIYRLELDALARANGILEPDFIVPGRHLALRWEAPADVGRAPVRAAEARAERNAEPAPQAAAPLRVVVPLQEHAATPTPVAPPAAAPEE
jgi:LysM repeat protein